MSGYRIPSRHPRRPSMGLFSSRATTSRRTSSAFRFPPNSRSSSFEAFRWGVAMATSSSFDEGRNSWRGGARGGGGSRRAPIALWKGLQALPRVARRAEHVLGAAQADTLGSELAGLACRRPVVGVCPDAELTDGVGPAEQRLEVAGQLGLDQRHLAQDHPARGPVDRDDV